MDTSSVLTLLVKAVDQASETLAGVAAQTDELAAQTSALNEKMDATAASTAKASGGLSTVDNSLKSVGSNMKTVGSSLSMWVTLPIVGIGTAAAVMAEKFQQSMTLLETQTGASKQQVAELTQQVLALAQNSAFGPDQLAQGLYHIVSLGVPANQVMHDLTETSKLAAVGNANLETTTNAVAVAWKSGIAGARDFGTSADTLNAIIGAGNMRMDDLVNALGPTGLLAAAKTAGLSLSDVGSAEALLADMTGNAQQSATHLRMALTLMSSGSAAANKDLQQIGLTTHTLAVDMQEGGLPEALGALKQHLDAMFGPTSLTSALTYTEVLKTRGPAAAKAFADASANAADIISKAFGGAKTGATMEQLLQGFSTGSLAQKEAQVSNTSAAANANFAETQKTAAFQIQAAWASIQSSLIQIGNAVLPVVVPWFTKLANGVKDVASWFEKLSPTQKEWVLGIAAALAVAGPLLVILGTIAGAIAALIALGTPFLITIGIIAGLGVAAALLMTHWRPVTAFFTDMWNTIRAEFQTAAAAIAVIIAALTLNPTALKNAWMQFVNDIPRVFEDLRRAFASGALGIVGALAPILSPLNEIYQLLNLIKGAITEVSHLKVGNLNLSSIIPHFASGVQNFSGGMALVGENGPEIVQLPSGSNVIPNRESQSLMQSGGSSGNTNVSVTFTGPVMGTNAQARQFAYQVGQYLQSIAKSNGKQSNFPDLGIRPL